jgi:hypothetical protein
VPLAGGKTATQNGLPRELDWLIFPGADNEFTLYEDDGETTAYQQGQYCLIHAQQIWQPNQMQITISPARGALQLLPSGRLMGFTIRGIVNPEVITLTRNDQVVEVRWHYQPETRSVSIEAVPVSPQDQLRLNVMHSSGLTTTVDGRKLDFQRLLAASRVPTDRKQTIANQMEDLLEQPLRLGRYASVLSQTQLAAFMEILCEAGTRDWQLECGDEKIVAWNNQCLPAFRYHFAHVPAGWMETGISESGSLPRFKAFIPKDLENQWGPCSWRLAINLADLVSLIKNNLNK